VRPLRQSLSMLLKIAFASTTPRKRGAIEHYGPRRMPATTPATCSNSIEDPGSAGTDAWHGPGHLPFIRFREALARHSRHLSKSSFAPAGKAGMSAGTSNVPYGGSRRHMRVRRYSRDKGKI